MKISGPSKSANKSFSSKREACSNALKKTAARLRLSSNARNTLILVKGFELDQTPGFQQTAGARLNAPGVYCWRALARQHTILFNRAKESQIFPDVRLEACAVEYYPGQLKRQSRAHHMAIVSSGIHSRPQSSPFLLVTVKVKTSSPGDEDVRDHFAGGNLTHAVRGDRKHFFRSSSRSWKNLCRDSLELPTKKLSH